LVDRGGQAEIRARDDASMLLVTQPSGAAAMQDPWLMVRPEGWEIAGPDTRGLPATIVDTTFIGDRLIVRADTAIGTMTASTGGYAGLDAGARIGLVADPARM